jgi:glutaredoxin
MKNGEEYLISRSPSMEEEQIEEPSMEELQKAIKEMKNNKSPEIDNMQVELNKMGGYDLHELIK